MGHNYNTLCYQGLEYIGEMPISRRMINQSTVNAYYLIKHEFSLMIYNYLTSWINQLSPVSVMPTARMGGDTELSHVGECLFLLVELYAYPKS